MWFDHDNHVVHSSVMQPPPPQSVAAHLSATERID
jgi:hypothetical protein